VNAILVNESKEKLRNQGEYFESNKKAVMDVGTNLNERDAVVNKDLGSLWQ